MHKYGSLYTRKDKKINLLIMIGGSARTFSEVYLQNTHFFSRFSHSIPDIYLYLKTHTRGNPKLIQMERLLDKTSDCTFYDSSISSIMNEVEKKPFTEIDIINGTDEIADAYLHSKTIVKKWVGYAKFSYKARISSMQLSFTLYRCSEFLKKRETMGYSYNYVMWIRPDFVLTTPLKLPRKHSMLLMDHDKAFVVSSQFGNAILKGMHDIFFTYGLNISAASKIQVGPRHCTFDNECFLKLSIIQYNLTIIHQGDGYIKRPSKNMSSICSV